MTDSPDDPYAGLASAIGAEVDAMMSDGAETPPAEPSPESSVPSTPATEPAAETPPATPEPGAELATPDPLEGAEPFTYKVDGEVRTLDGASVIPGVGAIIPTDLLATVQDRLGQADRLHAVNRAQYDTIQRFEQAGGADAIRQARTEVAQSNAAAVVMLQAMLDNPEVMAQVALAETREARLAILDQSVLRETRLAVREARLTVADQPQTPPIDLSKPETRETVLTNSVQHVAQQTAIAGLTPEDVAYVTAQAKRFHASILTPATPDEAKAAGVKPGDPIVQLQLVHDLLQDRAQWRATQQQVATAATAAARENAAKLATLARQKPAAPAKPAPPAPPAEEETWEQQKTRWAAGIFADNAA